MNNPASYQGIPQTSNIAIPPLPDYGHAGADDHQGTSAEVQVGRNIPGYPFTETPLSPEYDQLFVQRLQSSQPDCTNMNVQTSGAPVQSDENWLHLLRHPQHRQHPVQPESNQHYNQRSPSEQQYAPKRGIQSYDFKTRIPEKPDLKKKTDKAGFPSKSRNKYAGTHSSAQSSPKGESSAKPDVVVPQITIPKLNVTLLPHQLVGVQWLLSMEKGMHKGGLLADEVSVDCIICVSALK